MTTSSDDTEDPAATRFNEASSRCGMPDDAPANEKPRKSEWQDPSLDSERESDAVRERRREREGKRAEGSRDLRENE